ncbi:MAG: tautomerase family protein [Hyphomicrobiales bacterium]|nr:tautomerase family protein [Hyphomicrobiales bacterium]
MPILKVLIGAPRSRETTEAVVNTLLDLTVDILKKKREVTSIAVDYIDPQDWYVAGHSLHAQGKSSFYFDIKITDETNTKAEKAEFIAKAFDALSRLLGEVHEESYIHVEDVRAAAYGYGGRTQEYRYHHG